MYQKMSWNALTRNNRNQEINTEHFRHAPTERFKNWSLSLILRGFLSLSSSLLYFQKKLSPEKIYFEWARINDKKHSHCLCSGREYAAEKDQWLTIAIFREYPGKHAIRIVHQITTVLSGKWCLILIPQLEWGSSRIYQSILVKTA
jgi:hypothetical protein